MAFLKGLLHPDVPGLAHRNDVPGLARALQDKSPDVVRDAARAIATLHAQGDAGVRQQTESTRPALIAACNRVCGSFGMSDTMRPAGHALMEALGEVSAFGGMECLIWVVNTGNFERKDRQVALQAMTRIHGGAAWVAQLLGMPDERAELAAAALVERGDEGLPFLREYLLSRDRSTNPTQGEAGKVLYRVWEEGGDHAAAAEAIMTEVNAADSQARQQRPLDDEALRRLLWEVSRERDSWSDNQYIRHLEQSASWDGSSRQRLIEFKAELEKSEHEHEAGLATLRRRSDDPRVREYLAEALRSEDHLKRREAVRLMGKLERTDWTVAALQEVARSDPYQARRSTSSIEYSDPDVAEMYMETYFELREEAEQALSQLG